MCSSPFVALLLLVASLPALLAQAPCTLQWQAGNGVPGVDGNVAAMVPWDPDGPGPLPQQLAVAGTFQQAGAVLAANVAAYEPVGRTWSTFGPGVPDGITALATRPNGHLLAANTSVQEWNGTTWQSLGGPFFLGGVDALAVMPNGDVIAGGPFQGVGGVAIAGIARWNGTAWSAIGTPTTPFSLGRVSLLVVAPNGDLIVGGFFTHIAGVPCNFLARWDGVSWHPFAAGSANPVPSLTVLTNGDVVACGAFATATGSAHVARWNGVAWSDLGPLAPSNVAVVVARNNGGVVACSPTGLWASSGAGWTAYAPWNLGTNEIRVAVELPGGDLFVGGSFLLTPMVTAMRIARWNGVAWQWTTPGTNGPVRALAALPDGSFFAAGDFTSIGTIGATRLARFDGTTWSAIPSAAIGPAVAAVARPNGEVLAVGLFSHPTPGIVDRVVRWNGGQATAIAPGTWTMRSVRSLAVAPTGEAFLAYVDITTAQAGVLRWDGASLTPLPIAPNNHIDAMAVLPNGDLVLGGVSGVLRWNGVQLAPLSSTPITPVASLAVTRSGDLLVGGAFASPGAGIARWNGASWSPLGAGLNGTVVSMLELPNGDVVADERIPVNGVFTSKVQRWNGSQWTQLAAVSGESAVAWSPAGTLAIFGEFTQAGGAANAFFAQLRPACAASGVDRGGGCSGAAGPLTLRAVELPWLGGSLRTTTSGLPTGALSIGVFGFGAIAQPLAALHPLGVPGCLLLASDDILLQFAVVAGTVAADFVIPNAIALVGAQFQHQVLAVERSAAGHAIALTSSNGLQLTIGAL